MDLDEKIAKLKQMVEESDSIVFFGGAGVSTESGIADYRSVDGLYSQKYEYPPETMLSHSFFVKHTEEFYKFYKDKLVAPEAKPNAAHLKLAELEARGKLKAVITQNVDGLHQMAGSKQVYELHGSNQKNRCVDCGTFYNLDYVMAADGVPKCIKCGGVVKPEVVLYEESLNDVVTGEAIQHIRDADMLIIGGTSLVVYPAASFVEFYRGSKLVVINLAPLGHVNRSALEINAKIGEVLSQL
jgi:NAD-dependent deacetylase